MRCKAESSPKRWNRASLLIGVLAAATACSDGSIKYGPPDNLRVRGAADVTCTIPAGSDKLPPKTWQADVFPLMGGSGAGGAGGGTGGYGCTQALCHGSDNVNQNGGLHLDAMDPKASYEAMKAFTDPKTGKPYVSDTKPSDAFMLCNLGGDPALIGDRMPLGGKPVSKDDLQIIGKWVLSGMNEQGAGGAGGGK